MEKAGGQLETTIQNESKLEKSNAIDLEIMKLVNFTMDTMTFYINHSKIPA